MKFKFLFFMSFFMLSCSFSFAQEPMMGEIKMFAGNFAPRGWAFCDGQELKISDYSALFSLLGTNYGGDGRTTFALPDLRDRTPIHLGNKSDLYTRVGDKGGSESKELRIITLAEKPSGETYETYTVKSSNDKLYTRDPFLRINYIIALHGVFPSRN